MKGFIAPILSPRHSVALHGIPMREGTMFVSDIISQKGSGVFSVRAATSVAEVARDLTDLRIGSVLVLEPDNRTVGIVSERDLVRALARQGAKAMELEAGNVMTTDVVTCD